MPGRRKPPWIRSRPPWPTDSDESNVVLLGGGHGHAFSGKAIRMVSLPPQTTALVLIDLQNGIAGQASLAPRGGTEVVAAGKALASRFRQAAAPVILVNVGWSPDLADSLQQPVDRPTVRPAGGLPREWSDLVPGLAQSGDLRITKRQWGAFHGTELDLQLRRRGIRTIVLAGIATNLGVESTARQAWEHGYAVVVAEDACTTYSDAMHAFSMTEIMPRIARVRRSDQISFQ